MKPVVLGVAALLAFILIQFGQACSPGFAVLKDESLEIASSCPQDESNLASSVRADKRGYLNSKQVSYVDRGDGWILVEGDKLYRAKAGLPLSPGTKGISQGVGVSNSNLWPMGKVPFVIHANLSNPQRVADAVNHWNRNLAGTIVFLPRTNEVDYLEFREVADGCAAPVGHYAGEGPHPIELATNCSSGNVAHEMGHIVGLDHEQNRLDRDVFVSINLDRVKDGLVANFNITAGHRNLQNYDFGSMMHYGLNAFSKDGSPTIVPRVNVPADVVIGQRQSLSHTDIQSVLEMYGARVAPPTPTSMPMNENRGLFGHYYASTEFQNQVLERTDSTLDFDWGNAAPANEVPVVGFSVRWKGWIQPSSDGRYELMVRGQGGYRLILDGAALMNRLGATGFSQQQSPALQMKAGQKYRIIIELIGRERPASIRLGWRKDGTQESLIPRENLIPDLVSDLASNLCTGT